MDNYKALHGMLCPSSSDQWFQALVDRGRFKMRDFKVPELHPQKEHFVFKN